MDLIKEALSKAKASLEQRPSPREHRDRPAWLPGQASPAQKAQPEWSLEQATLDPAHLTRHRIVSYGMDDPSHMAFNQLRTRLLKALTDNGWTRVAITSPSPGCGKTMVAVNLALSMARIPHCRTALIDLDLRKSSVGRVLGVHSQASLGGYYAGEAELQQCFLQITPSLVVGLNDRPLDNSAELIQGPRTADLFSELAAALNPNFVIFDLPPLLSNDDAIGFIPNVDAVLMVVASGTSTATEVDECERQISGLGKYVGLILNKADGKSNKYKYGY